MCAPDSHQGQPVVVAQASSTSDHATVLVGESAIVRLSKRTHARHVRVASKKGVFTETWLQACHPLGQIDDDCKRKVAGGHVFWHHAARLLVVGSPVDGEALKSGHPCDVDKKG
jgi:hypothetical protein